jgi:4-amino-4-deoxy-L-arabinose transferase-like glycosyltransferase
MTTTTADTLAPTRAERPARLRALLRGRADDPAWARPALIGLLAATAFLYLVDLAASGYANAFYSAAVEAGAKSWKAFFFGSFDSSNFITVDKPPASLWVMDLSARIFGVNAWSILVPQAVEGVAAVGLLYATVRRRFSAPAGLLAGTVFALTPVAALMFRFNNPDALLTLLLVGAAYAVTRALEDARTSWLLLAGGLVGLGFLTKMLQAFLVVPGFAAVYLLAAPTTLRRRLVQLLLGGAAMVAAAAWWVAIVALWPASSRPYIGGSQTNSILELIFGYNGFGRITGDETGSVVGGQAFGGGGAGPRGGMWGPTGLTRLFGGEMGTQVSWLIPAALVLGAAALWGLRRARHRDGRRAAILLWGSWLVVTGLVFSLAKGIIHPYYNVVLGPAIGALVGIGVVFAWARRESVLYRLVLAGSLGATSIWAFVLLDRTPSWHPALRYTVLMIGVAAAVLIVAGPLVWGQNRAAARAVLLVALAAALAAPAAYSAQTAATPHSGSLPTAGPSGSTSGPGAGGRRAVGAGGPPGSAFGGGNGGPPAGFGAGGGGFPSAAGGGFGSRGGGLGGLLDASTPSKALVTLLETNASSYRWVAAIVGANSAAGVQLATSEPVMAIGGFNGTDPSPTLAEFKADVASGKIHYFVTAGSGLGGGGFGGGPGASQSSRAIASWVESSFAAKTVGGVTVYDLTG